MTGIRDQVEEFFERYAAALLARVAVAVPQLYAILFPDTAIPVTDPSQTEQFFASAWEQYEGIDAASREIVVMGEAPSSVWADVTWRYGGDAGERFCYQLIATPAAYQIAVLTPMEFIP
jgi:hypothetical protein